LVTALSGEVVFQTMTRETFLLDKILHRSAHKQRFTTFHKRSTAEFFLELDRGDISHPRINSDAAFNAIRAYR
jgi:hypothetical protein